MSNELELFATSKSTEIPNTSKATQNNSQKKEGESLFDKFLTKAKTDIENAENETKSNVKNEKEVKKDSKIEKAEKSDNSKLEPKTETKADIAKTDGKPLSLMDRLIQETKSNVKNEKEVKKDSKIEKAEKAEKSDNSKLEAKTETKVDTTKIDGKSLSLMDRLIQETKSNVKSEKEVKKDIKTEKTEKADNLKGETKVDITKTDGKATSLIDRLIEETKSNVKNKKEVKKDSKIEKAEKSDKTDNLKSESKTETKVDASKTDGKITSLNNASLGEVKSNAKEVKKEIKTEKTDVSKSETKTEIKVDTTKINGKATSLNDGSDEKVKSDVKEVKKEIKTEKIDNSNTEAKSEVKTTSLGSNLVQELDVNAKEVKNDINAHKKEKVDTLKNEIKNNLNIDDTKNTEATLKTDSKSENKISSDKKNILNESNNLSNKEVEKETPKQKVSNETKDTKNQNLNLNKTLPSENIQKKVVKNNNESSKLNLEKDSSKDLNSEVKNLKTTNDSSKLNVETKNEKTTLSNEKVVSSEEKNTKSESLIDKLLRENAPKKQELPTEQLIKSTLNNSSEMSKSKNDLLTNIYMSSQKKSVDVKKLETKHEGVEIAKKATTTKEVEQSAKVLNLGLEKVEIKIEKSVEPQSETKISSTFERLSFIKNGTSNSKESKDSNEEKFKDDKGSFLIQNKKLDDKLLDSKLVNLSVSSAAAQTIQNRIIGARQHMSTMMSDLARVMYENYNPPVTAFRVNLNPSALGHIAILIRGDAKNNSLSISMKSSNNSTKENLVENQSMLKDSLFKSFAGAATSFDLDFGSYEGDSTPSENPNMEQNKEISSKTITTNNKIEETEIKDSKDKYYM